MGVSRVLARHPWEEAGLPPEDVIFGQSGAMQSVRHKISKAGIANVPVLLQGESGTGKDLLARVIHSNSNLSSGPFVKVSCPAIPGTLLESELFGYEKGAFTGAYGTKPGRVEMANRGTLFLDEIGEMDPGLQAKLLQVLQDGHFCRIGAQGDRRIDVRIICATNRNLEAEIEAGHFRRDLFYRVNVLNISLPALRERASDIPALADYFLHCYEEFYQLPVRPIPRTVLRQMEEYSWPGNIREMENVVRRYVILGSDSSVFAEALSTTTAGCEPKLTANGSVPLKEAIRQATQQLERGIIRRALEANGWNRKRAAGVLQISYRTLLYKLKEAGVPPKRRLVAEPREKLAKE